MITSVFLIEFAMICRDLSSQLIAKVFWSGLLITALFCTEATHLQPLSLQSQKSDTLQGINISSEI